MTPTRIRYVVLMALCVVAALAYAQRGVLSVAESTVRAALEVTEDDTGRAMSVFFLVYAIFQIPAGVLADRWGGRKSLLLFGMLGAATMALGAVGTFAALFAGRALMGVAQAGLFPASTLCIRAWFPVERRASALGTLTACMSVGGAFGAFLTGRLLGVMTWQSVFLFFAVPGAIWSVCFFVWYRDRPEERPARTEQITSTPWVALFTRPQLGWLCAQQFFRAMANVVYLSWLPTLLQKVYDIDRQTAGEYTAYPMLGVVAGSLLGGVASDAVLTATGDRRFARRSVAVVSLAVGVVLFGVAYAMTDVVAAVGVMTLAAMFSSLSNPCAYSATIDLGGRHTGAVFSTMNMCGNIGAAIFPMFVPIWVSWFGGEWAMAIVLVAGLYALGLMCWLMIDAGRELLAEAD